MLLILPERCNGGPSSAPARDGDPKFGESKSSRGRKTKGLGFLRDAFHRQVPIAFAGYIALPHTAASVRIKSTKNRCCCPPGQAAKWEDRKATQRVGQYFNLCAGRKSVPQVTTLPLISEVIDLTNCC
jgi:hypothetical protein